MNILITGGTGLIGKALIAKLKQRTCNLTVLTRDASNAVKVLGNGISFIEQLTLNDIEHKDIIINLAGEPIAGKRWSKSQKEKICHSRWHITKQLANFINLAKKPPSLFISGSAIGIYGRQYTLPINEDFTDYHHEFTHEVCSKWELTAMAAESNNTRVAILRTGIVLDKNAGALAKMLVPFKLGLGGKISNGEQIMSWIHINDVVAAILHIQKTDTLNGAINITAEKPVNNRDFSYTLAKVLQRPALIKTPSPLLRIMFGEMADLLLFGQNVIPNKLINSGFTFQYPTLKKALKNLLDTRVC